MPIYDMFCKECGYELKDELVTLHEITLCPTCNHKMTNEMPSTNFKIKDSRLTKHLHKYGNDSRNTPSTKDNGVKIYGKKRRH